MDHSEAAAMSAVERYVLGDLSVSEIEEFERHFFDCPQCSEELRTMAMFQDNARAVFAWQDPRPAAASRPVPAPEAPRASWWTFKRFVPAFAMFAIAAFGGYEAGERHAAPAPQAVAEFPLYAAARGQETVIAPPSGAKFYTLYIDKTWDRDYGAYRASFTTGGVEKFSMPLAAPAPGQSIHILVPLPALPSGRYTLIVSAEGAEVARYPFTLRIE